MKVIKCDTCGKKLSIGNSGMVLREIGNPFPLKLDVCSVDYDFCSWKCLWKFVTNEIHKENPRTDIEFGKEK